MVKPHTGLRVVITGLIAQHCKMGGVTWDYLNVLLGFKRLGHEVYYIEDSGEWPYRLDGTVGAAAMAEDCSANVAYLDRVMSRFDLGDKWAYRSARHDEWFGLTESRRADLLQTADLLINVSGTIEHPDRYRSVRCLVYIDTDPVFTQIRYVQGDKLLSDRIDAHDRHFTVGERLGSPVPDTGHQWIPTKHPIALSEWEPNIAAGDRFTTIMNWTSYAPLSFEGLSFGQKDAEFRNYLQLPSRVNGSTLEIAMAKTQHADWEADPNDGREESTASAASVGPVKTLRHNGWSVVDSVDVAGDLDSYRNYVIGSKAEWSVAKQAYVVGHSGWFSGRSACYLAAGRPVVVQETGFSESLPTGRGVIAFRSLPEAVEAIADVEGNYQVHAEAARDIAFEYFDSDKVIQRLLERI